MQNLRVSPLGFRPIERPLGFRPLGFRPLGFRPLGFRPISPHLKLCYKNMC